MIDRNQIEDLENRMLAPYALRASKSVGRRYPEEEHTYRSCFQRDRDRVIHCAAFRRLEYKTQVFLNWQGDHFRTRLTHTPGSRAMRAHHRPGTAPERRPV